MRQLQYDALQKGEIKSTPICNATGNYNKYVIF